MFGLYLHLPLRPRRCRYCNFYLTPQPGKFEMYLQALRRPAARAETAAVEAWGAGFADIGIDLIFGLPGQSPAGARADLATVAGWPVQHISHYALEVEGATVLGKAILERRKSAWDDDLEARL